MNTSISFNWRFALAALILSMAFCATGFAASEKLTIPAFEASPFFTKHKAYNRDNWKLKSGGSVYSYGFHDVDNTMSGIGVSLTNDASDIQEVGLTFYGRSLGMPASFTEARRTFLEDLISSTFPDVPKKKLITLVKSRQKLDYEGGSNTMERLRVGNYKVRTGRVGPDIVIVINK